MQPEYKIADPICTYVFSVLVVFTTIRILCDTGVIILEGKICAQSAVLYMENTSFLDIMIPISVWVILGTCLSWCCCTLVALHGSSKFQQFLGVFDCGQNNTSPVSAQSLPSGEVKCTELPCVSAVTPAKSSEHLPRLSSTLSHLFLVQLK